MAGCVDRLMAASGLAFGEIDRVFLTGGSSFVPAVRRIFVDRFGEEKVTGGEELTSVATGLALRAREQWPATVDTTGHLTNRHNHEVTKSRSHKSQARNHEITTKSASSRCHFGFSCLCAPSWPTRRRSATSLLKEGAWTLGQGTTASHSLQRRRPKAES